MSAIGPIPYFPDYEIARLDEMKNGYGYPAQPLQSRINEVTSGITGIECSPVTGEEYWTSIPSPQVRGLTLVWAERAKAIIDEIVRTGQAARSAGE